MMFRYRFSIYKVPRPANELPFPPPGSSIGIYLYIGARASQVVKHVHYHIIPRQESYTPSRAWTMFGKGSRSDLDDDEAALIAARIRQEIAWEMERMGNSMDTPLVRTNFLSPKL
ncbi:hypothetical protein AA313_de0210000 [Arthrobotrys entomopaga]|nr:hypothetical protein AA313_de0210000 [Arthrobotrys entomopaga]